MQWLKKKEVWVVIILLAVIMINRITAQVNLKYSEKGVQATIEDLEVKVKEDEEKPAEEVLKAIKVDISGAVNKPGVYTLEEGDRIENVVQLAGGFTAEANTNLINQAEYVEDGQKIIVLKKGESMEAVNQGYSGPINLNTATVDQLTNLNGIGEKTAQKIVSYRQQNGDFSTVEDLLKVSGIGPSKLDGMRGEITVK